MKARNPDRNEYSSRSSMSYPQPYSPVSMSCPYSVGTLLYETGQDKFWIVTQLYEDGCCEIYSQKDQISCRINPKLYNLEVAHNPGTI